MARALLLVLLVLSVMAPVVGCGKSAPPAVSASAAAGASERYVDPVFHYSLVVDGRFAGAAVTDDSGAKSPLPREYTVSWEPVDSAEFLVEGERWHDSFEVSVLENPLKAQVFNKAVRVMKAKPVEFVAQVDAGRPALSAEYRRLAGRPAVHAMVDLSGGDGSVTRSRVTYLLTHKRLYRLTGTSSAGTWQRNLEAFNAMIASFKPAAGER